MKETKQVRIEKKQSARPKSLAPMPNSCTAMSGEEEKSKRS
jgi:hypothetical protein